MTILDPRTGQTVIIHEAEGSLKPSRDPRRAYDQDGGRGEWASALSVLSDDELLAAITRDLRAIYSDVIRQPLPEALAAALQRLEDRAVSHEGSGSGIHPGGPSRGASVTT